MRPRRIKRNNNGCYYEADEIKNNRLAEWIWNHNKINIVIHLFLDIGPYRWTDGKETIYWFGLL